MKCLIVNQGLIMSTSMSKCPFLTKNTSIISNFVPNEPIACDDPEPPWINQYKKIVILPKIIFIKVSRTCRTLEI